MTEEPPGVFDVGIFQIGHHGHGIEEARRMRREERVTRVVFWTGTVDDKLIAEASKIGTVVAKTDGLNRLIRVLSESKSRRIRKVNASDADREAGPHENGLGLRKAGLGVEREDDEIAG